MGNKQDKTDADFLNLTITVYAVMKTFLYQQLSDRLARMIDDQTLKTGAKLPSVRSLSKEQGVSLSTAFQAYIDLENKGLIISKPKSGYYVRFSPGSIKACSDSFREITASEALDTNGLIRSVHDNALRTDITHFSVNVPSEKLLPAAKLKKAVHHALNANASGLLNYEQAAGNALLRTQIARLSFNSGAQVDKNDVIVTSGCLEAIHLALQAATSPGDKVAIESPTYYGIHQAVTQLGRIPVEIPTYSKDGPDLYVLERAVAKEQIKACVFVTNFSNPVGSCMPDDNKIKLVQLADQCDIKVIEVDIYGELCFGEVRPKTCKAFDHHDRVILCSSFSKCLAPGYRVGWILPGRSYQKVLQLKMTQSVASPSLTQAAVAHFIENGRYDLHIRKLRKALHVQSLQYLKDIYQHFPKHIRVTQPLGGYSFWVELQHGSDTSMIFAKALKQGVSFAPGQIFSHKFDFRHCLRISFGHPYDDRTGMALRKLGKIIHEATG